MNEKQKEVLEYQISNELLKMGLVTPNQTNPEIIKIDESEWNGDFVFNYEDVLIKGRFYYITSLFNNVQTSTPIEIYTHRIVDVSILDEVNKQWNDELFDYEYVDVEAKGEEDEHR